MRSGSAAKGGMPERSTCKSWPTVLLRVSQPRVHWLRSVPHRLPFTTIPIGLLCFSTPSRGGTTSSNPLRSRGESVTNRAAAAEFSAEKTTNVPPKKTFAVAARRERAVEEDPGEPRDAGNAVAQTCRQCALDQGGTHRAMRLQF